MKILRLTTALDFGGVEKVYEVFARSYSGGHEYIFLALGRLGHTAMELKKLGFEVHTLNIEKPNVYKPVVSIKLYRWLKDHDIDILHTASAEANFHGSLVAKLAGVRKVIIEEIGIPNHSVLGRLMFRFSYKLADDFLWISSAVRDRVIALKEVRPGTGTLIHNPVEVPKVEPLTRQFFGSEYLTIASIGRLATVKNFPLLIQLISKLNISGVPARLILIGEGPDRSLLESMVKEYDLVERVEIHGFSTNPIEEIKSADIYVQPSFTEGFGIALVEAMILGLPAIGSNVGGLLDIIDHGVNGWFMNPNAPVEDLIRLVLQIKGMDSENLLSVAREGRRSSIERFKPEAYINKLEAFYGAERIDEKIE